MRIDWYNVARTFAQLAIVAIGAALAFVSKDWLVSVGVSADWANLVAVVAVALAAWWRQKWQSAFEPKG